MLGTGSANRATVSMLSVNAENTVRNLFEVKPPSIQCRVDYCFPHSASVSICERNLKGPLAIFSPHSADAIVAGDYWQDAGVIQMTGLAPTVSCEEAVSLKQITADEFEGRETQVAASFRANS